MVYEENPKYLGEVLATLVGEEMSGRVGVTFRQQQQKQASVPDGLIVQDPLVIYIETSTMTGSTSSNLSNIWPLDGEIGYKLLLALGNFDSIENDCFPSVGAKCEVEYGNRIVFRAVSFEDLIRALEMPGFSKNLADAITDLRAFLNEEDLLPTWRDLLDVVNCAGKPEDIIDGDFYACPAEGGDYSHARCRYFGMYRKRCVEVCC